MVHRVPQNGRDRVWTALYPGQGLELLQLSLQVFLIKTILLQHQGYRQPCMRMRTHGHMHTCTNTCEHTHRDTHSHTCMHVHIQTHACVHTCTPSFLRTLFAESLIGPALFPDLLQVSLLFFTQVIVATISFLETMLLIYLSYKVSPSLCPPCPASPSP